MDEQITIVIEPGESGWWIATVPEVPGAVSQGRTQVQVREMVLDCLHELMAFRRDEALKEAGSSATIERIRLAG
jgi:predicted RNase H-like HicB family nuclease